MDRDGEGGREPRASERGGVCECGCEGGTTTTMASWFAERLRQAEALLNQADQLAYQAKRRVEEEEHGVDAIQTSMEPRQGTDDQASHPLDTPKPARSIHLGKEHVRGHTRKDVDDGERNRDDAKDEYERRGKEEKPTQDVEVVRSKSTHAHERPRTRKHTKDDARYVQGVDARRDETNETVVTDAELGRGEPGTSEPTKDGHERTERGADEKNDITKRPANVQYQPRRVEGTSNKTHRSEGRDMNETNARQRTKKDAPRKQTENDVKNNTSKDALQALATTNDAHVARVKESRKATGDARSTETIHEDVGTTSTSVHAASVPTSGSIPTQTKRNEGQNDAPAIAKDTKPPSEHVTKGLETTLKRTSSHSSKLDTKRFKDAAMDTLYILGLAESDSEQDSDEEAKEKRKEYNRKMAEDKLIHAVRTEVEKLETRNAEKDKERQALESNFRAKRMEHLKQVQALQQAIQERVDSRSKEKDAAEVERLQAWEKVALLEADRDAMAQKLSELERSSNLALASEQEAQSICTDLEAACAQLQSEISTLTDKMESRKRYIAFEAQEKASKTSEEQQRELAQLEESVAALEKQIEEYQMEHDRYGSMHTREDQEMDARLHALSNNLIHMQAELESLATEKAALQMGLETTQRMIAEFEASSKDDHRYFAADAEPDVESGDSQAKARRRSQVFLRLSSYFGVEYAHYITTFLANADRFSMTACNLLYRYSLARVGLAVYFAVIQFWVLFLLHYMGSYSGSSNGTQIHFTQ